MESIQGSLRTRYIIYIELLYVTSGHIVALVAQRVSQIGNKQKCRSNAAILVSPRRCQLGTPTQHSVTEVARLTPSCECHDHRNTLVNRLIYCTQRPLWCEAQLHQFATVHVRLL